MPPARLSPEAFEISDIVVAAPPETPRARTHLVARFLPVVMAVATVGMMAAVFFSRSGAAHNPAFMMFPLTMLLSTVATVVSGADRLRGEINADRAEYLAYLSDLRARVVKIAAAQRSSLVWRHPDPDTLWTLVGGCRMWERQPADADFCQIRIGVGAQRLAARLIPPQIASVHQLDPVTVTAMRRFLQTHSTVQDSPVAIGLHGVATVTLRGDAPHTRALLRAMICQLAVLHSPSLLVIAGAIADRNRTHWDWLKWLPHNQHPYANDRLGPARMVFSSLAEAERTLAGLTVGDAAVPPSRVIIVDGDVVGMRLKIDTADDRQAAAGVLRMQVSANELTGSFCGDDEVFARPDRMSHIAALVCAQRLAGYRACRPDAFAGTSGAGAGWQHLLGIDDLESYTPTHRWKRESPRDRLRVPIGLTAAGETLELDIKEAAENGMGPHGLCIGATGSGKSEFLRTVALGMMVCHSPETLNLVLIDFKGGATFLGLEPAPHVAAVITNLSDKAALVARTRDALAGEINRRQEVLRAAGNLDDIIAYRDTRRADTRLAPLPALFIIVDEFSELLSQHPDFADVFVGIGRVGRSLGMHLLLASQRLDEGRLRGLETHLSYRVCLKTLSGSESRIVLGTSDAYELPGTPGAAYLRAGTDELVRFQTAYVSCPCRSETSSPPMSGEAPAAVRLFTVSPIGQLTHADAARSDASDRRTVLQAVVKRLSAVGPPAHEVWLPPLGAAPALDTVLRETGSNTEHVAMLSVPIGIVDRPFEQRRTPLVVDLSGAAGNVAVAGAPQSGKSTALRTLITALSVTHDPSSVQFYCLDFGGGTLASLRSWPHVGSVAGRADPQLAERMVRHVEAIVRSRENAFRDHGIESMEQYRQLKAQGDPACDRFGDVFLIVDGWSRLRREFEALETPIADLAGQGLSFGVHVVVSASRWAEIRPALKDQIGTRIELRLGDPADSELDRRRAQQVPEGEPGRGLSHDGLHMVIALPRLDGSDSTSGLADAGARVAEMLRVRHRGCTVPPIPVLPARIDRRSLVEQATGGLGAGILIGLEDSELLPVAIDFTQQRHLLIIGDGECGKTTTLRTLCQEIVRTTTAAESQLLIVDFRRSLLSVVEPDTGQLEGYLVSADAVGAQLPRLVDRLRERLPPADVTPIQLRTRSWWAGPEIYIMVDDYDLIATTAGNPLMPLLEFVPQARDVGLHLLVACRSGGAVRAMFEPLLAAVRDAGCMTLLMSGSPNEGVVIGSVRQSLMPPGRGTLIARRGDAQLVQIAWSPPP